MPGEGPVLDRIATVTIASLCFALTVGPALADGIRGVPEPTTMTLFGLGVGGAYIAKRVFGRK